MAIVLEGEDEGGRGIEGNLYKLVNVLWVQNTTDATTMARELALIKVRTTGVNRGEVMRLCDVFRARVVDVGPDALVAGITGAADKLEGLVHLLLPCGIPDV